MLDQFAKFVAPLKRRVMGMVGRCVIQAVKEDKALQRLQATILADETLDGIESLGHYGFASSPLQGAEGVALFLGERSHGVVIATEDRRYRLKVENGEVALYTDEGDSLHFKRGNELHVTTGKFKFQGGSDELMDLVIQLCQLVSDTNDKLSTTTTNTMLGPQPLLEAGSFGGFKSDADDLKAKLEGIKV